MPTYLCKSEPDDYSIDDLKRDGSTIWDGVTNPTACIHIRGIVKGDEILIYHTGGEKAVTGLAVATGGAYHDPERDEATTKAGDIKFPVFDLKYRKTAKTPVTLAEFKADTRFADFELVKLPRLSVMPVPPKLDTIIRELAGLS
ncbi:MAG: EVE domain-containing protein [Planctomycetota bacterium]